MPSLLSEIQQKINESNELYSVNKKAVASEELELKEKREQDDKARHSLTFHFVWGFFGLIVGCFLFVLWYNSHAIDWIKTLNTQGLSDAAASVKLLELDKVLSVIIGALGTSLGFIIGYYFKEKKG
ncbi:hypothetical protein [Xenorhabdus bovienii]|uniref:hypothetical protein n=1 Tax=Xenorhabdus bovienii TaxID=40576 RepID=UPI0023B33A99|nr:hypothetical protein [Xenorhabdus bovienii]MDE9458794.1 hypothetical protein [Xenorhabdus bovienii]MDE9487157.1 hypothetical protein [Xenorhabdus bovienii]MDE9515025.1 hypothetical protein [Xenorhabdus bovienii]